MAKGYQRNGSDLRRIVISMDEETFIEVREMAWRDRCSFAAEARMLIEVGLETLKLDPTPEPTDER